VSVSYLPEIDEGVCAGHGDCTLIAPEVFELDGVARVIDSGPDELVLAAAESCPSSAIRIIDADSGAQVFP
jgi:ferredoxin